MKKNDAGYEITVNSAEGGYTVFWDDEDAYELPAIEDVLFLDPFMSSETIKLLDEQLEDFAERQDILKTTRDVVEGR